jgi:membrane-associated phospholipid phosphatase
MNSLNLNLFISSLLMVCLGTQSHSLASEANPDIPSASQSYYRSLFACRQSEKGCTIQQELSIAQVQGKVLDAEQLNQQLAQDTERSIFIPLSLNNQELLTLAAATSIGVVAFHNDQQIMDVVQQNRSATTEPIANVGNFIGSTAFLPIAAGAYFFGVYYHDNKLMKAGLFTVSATLATGLVTLAVKSLVGRARPNKGEGPYSFFNRGDQSFYSGHTAQAFTLATLFSEMYKNEYPVVPWIAYGLASVTAYARVHDQAHWASDVIIGAVAGHLITKLFLSAMNEDTENRSGIAVYPKFNSSSELIGLDFRYEKRFK